MLPNPTNGGGLPGLSSILRDGNDGELKASV
jgi:hypothetical protein